MTRWRIVAAVLVPAVAGCGDDGEETPTAEVDDTMLDPFSLQALTATDRGAVGLTAGDEVLDVGRFTDD